MLDLQVVSTKMATQSSWSSWGRRALFRRITYSHRWLILARLQGNDSIHKQQRKSTCEATLYIAGHVKVRSSTCGIVTCNVWKHETGKYCILHMLEWKLITWLLIYWTNKEGRKGACVADCLGDCNRGLLLGWMWWVLRYIAFKDDIAIFRRTRKGVYWLLIWWSIMPGVDCRGGCGERGLRTGC